LQENPNQILASRADRLKQSTAFGVNINTAVQEILNNFSEAKRGGVPEYTMYPSTTSPVGVFRFSVEPPEWTFSERPHEFAPSWIPRPRKKCVYLSFHIIVTFVFFGMEGPVVSGVGKTSQLIGLLKFRFCQYLGPPEPIR
jgi:hypothetical protein